MKFKKNDGEDIIRPWVPILVENPDTGQVHKPILALLDTGADASLFPAYIPNATGHNLKHPDVKTSVNFGIGGLSLTTWKHTFRISILEPGGIKPVWSTKKILVDCIDGGAQMPPLLGTSGFLEHLKITFNYKTKKIIIEFPD